VIDISAAQEPASDRPYASIRRLLPWVGTEWRRLLLAVLLASGALACGVGLLATSAWLISRAAQQPPIMELEVAIVAVRAFGIGRGVLRYAERLVSHDAAFRALSRLRLSVYERLAIVAPAGIPAYQRGDLLERMVRDVDAIQDLPLRVAIPYVSGALVCIGSAILAWSILPAAGVVLAVSLLFASTVVPYLATVSAADAERQTAEVRGSVNAQALALVDGLDDLLLTGADAQWLTGIDESSNRLNRLRLRSAGASALAASMGVLLSGGAVLVTLLVAIPAVGSGQLDGVNLAVLALLPLATYEAVSIMPGAALSLAKVRGSADRVVAVLDAPDPVQEPREPMAVPVDDLSLTMTQVRSSWPGGAVMQLPGTIEVPLGTRVGIVGPSGVGKSTLLAVLAGFLPYEGDIRLGGTQLREMTGRDIRTVIGWCPQLPHIFETSIVENVRLARPEATDEQVRGVLDDVRLGPWLDSLEAGMDTHVGVGQISAGQRQRIGVARVLLAGHRIVLLDEPTEHLDEANAALVADELLRVLDGRTVIWVAHRPHGIESLDAVVRVEHVPVD
jgi:thiol reductant ABC exporter CydC subunit